MQYVDDLVNREIREQLKVHMINNKLAIVISIKNCKFIIEMISFSITIKLATTNYQGESKRRCSLLLKLDANEGAAVARDTMAT